MRVKRYVVDSMPDALEKIRLELGKDAVILNSKPVKTGGFLGLFSKRQIEVIAAVDDKQPEAKQTAGRPAGKSQKTVSEPSLVSAQSFAAKQAYQRSVNPPTAEGESPRQAEAPRQAVATSSIRTAGAHTSSPLPTDHKESFESVAGTATSTLVKPAIASQTAPEFTPAPPVSTPAAPVATHTGSAAATPNGEILRELRDMREAFQKLLLKPEGHENLPAPLCSVRDRLLAQEVDQERVISILQEMAKRTEDVNGITVEAAMQQARVVIEEQLQKVTASPVAIGRSTKFAFFFGPTGVGKTTTIAKLAAESMLKERRKVGFITTDTFRIGAVEQLKTYANILNVPVEVVFTPKDLPQAMERLMHCDLIFVDTAGRNYRSEEYASGIAEYLEQGRASENYLVLSLTSRYIDMKAILNQLQEVSIHKMIFTKADETQVYGPILNLAHDYGIPFSYITIGQNVPDDILVASSEVVSKLIIGEESYA